MRGIHQPCSQRYSARSCQTALQAAAFPDVVCCNLEQVVDMLLLFNQRRKTKSMGTVAALINKARAYFPVSAYLPVF